MASPKSTPKAIENPKSRQSEDPLPSSTATSPTSHNTRRSVSFADDVALEGATDSLTAIPPCPPSPPPAESPSNSSQDLKQPWYTRLLSSYRSISLENKGSVARDHLALERTFLAWLRTSLAFSSIGIAITQLFRLNTSLAEEAGQTSSLSSSILPLSPLMGASLTPEAYALALQTTLDQHLARASRFQTYAHSAHATLLDQLVRAQAFDSGAARRLRRLGKPLGATFLGISVVILLIGFRRYFESQHWIIRGQFPASRGSVALTGAIAAALIVASLVIVLVVVPGAYNT